LPLHVFDGHLALFGGHAQSLIVCKFKARLDVELLVPQRDVFVLIRDEDSRELACVRASVLREVLNAQLAVVASTVVLGFSL